MGTPTEGLATTDYVRGIDTRLIKAQNAARGGWQRYYRSDNGTLHLNTGCAALVLAGGARSLIPQLSGAEPQEVVDALGDQVRICTGCLRTAEDEARRTAAQADGEALAS